MGFQREFASLALKLCNNDINMSIQVLLSMSQSNYIDYNKLDDCKNNVTNCKYIKLLSKLMNTYNQYSHEIGINDDVTNEILSKIKFVDVLNAFNHSSFNHNLNDDHFEYIYKSFNESKCDAKKCNILRQH